MDVTESVYGHLRAIAGAYLRGRSSETLEPTALVSEAFLKLSARDAASFESREHFIAVAARAMRQILVDHTRAKRSQKRGGERDRVTLSGLAGDDPERVIDILALDAALSQLAALQPRHAQVVELRYFGGMTMAEIARTLGVSTATVERDWTMARAWLVVRLEA